jgi:poly-beta-1,6-N-acetyl-D-glucosamine N-deacetylase
MYKRIKLLSRYFFSLYLFLSGKLRREIISLKKQNCILPVYDHSPDPYEFERYIIWLKKKGFKFISTEQMIEYFENKYTLNGCYIWFSFDDGWKSNMELLPVIEKHQVPITIFVTTRPMETGYFRDYIERKLRNNLPEPYCKDVELLKNVPEATRLKIDIPLYSIAEREIKKQSLDKYELKKIATHNLVSIGGHTHNHPNLLQCNEKEIIAEIKNNISVIKEETHIDIKIMSIPYNRYNQQAIESIKEAGINYIAISNSGKITLNSDFQKLPRNGIAKACFIENCCRMIDFWYPNTAKMKRMFKNPIGAYKKNESD